VEEHHLDIKLAQRKVLGRHDVAEDPDGLKTGGGQGCLVLVNTKDLEEAFYNPASLPAYWVAVLVALDLEHWLAREDAVASGDVASFNELVDA
jgi:hypothetical protein